MPAEREAPVSLATNLIDPLLIPENGGPPHALFDDWRANDPVHWNPPSERYRCPMPRASLHQGFWVLTRHQDVVDVSRNQALFSSHEGSPVIWDFEPQQLAQQRAGLMGMKPADHRAVKRLVMPPFAPAELDRFRPDIDRVARSIVDSVAGNGSCEFVFDVASRLPVHTFCKLLGVPDERRETVFKLGNQTADTERTDREQAAAPAFYQLFAIAQQLTALLKEIVFRIPDIRPDGELEMLKSIWFNAIIRMPVAFTPES